MRHAGVLALVVLAACGGPDEQLSPDAPSSPPIDAPASIVDAPIDGDTCNVDFTSCVPTPAPQPAWCAAAVALVPGTPRTAQDSATGGFGDCAASASGIGGPSLYYAVEVPAQRYVRVEAAPTDPTRPAVVRAMSDCGSHGVLTSGRGGDLTAGHAAICVRNDGATPLSIIVAVSQYSGEAQCATLVFDVEAEVSTLLDGCDEFP